MLKLKQPVRQKPLKLGKTSPAVGTPARALGWGNMCRDDDCWPEKLQELTLSVSKKRGDRFAIQDKYFRGVAPGDSDGPLVVKDKKAWRLVGVLAVSSVVVNNEPATFSTKNGTLTITPKWAIGQGGQLRAEVRSSDTPGRYPGGNEHGSGWKRTANGALAMFSSAWWYPIASDRADKATLGLKVVVPTGLEVVANGTLSGGQLPVPGGDRWTWRNEVPQMAFLALLAIGQYDLKVSTGPGGKQLVTVYANDLGPLDAPARASAERTPDIVAGLSRWFGPYPFAALGGLVDKESPAPVGTATRPICSGKVFEDGAAGPISGSAPVSAPDAAGQAGLRMRCTSMPKRSGGCGTVAPRPPCSSVPWS